MKKSLLTFALTALSIAPVMAAESYAVLDVGQSSLSNCTGCSNPSGVRIGAGYQYKPNLAFEASYAALGNSTDRAGTTAKFQALQFAAIISLPLSDAFALTGKIGVASTMLDVIGFQGATNINATYGVGAQFNISKQFAVRAQYENLGRFGNTNTTGIVDAALFSAGLVMNF